MKRIALVEDNEDNRLLVEAFLGERYALDLYASGDEALAGIETRTPDLVLLDISLPIMSGSEVLRRIREHPSLYKLPVIALTAHAMSGDREKFLAEGFDDYISKPILGFDKLYEPIDKLLQARLSSA